MAQEASIGRSDGEPQEQEHGSLQNVGDLERIASVAIGGLLGFLAFRQRNAWGAGLGLLGLMLAGRGVAGRCALYRRAGFDTTSRLKLPRGLKLPALGNRELREGLRRFTRAVEAGELEPHGDERARSEMKRVRPPDPEPAWESA